MKHLDSLRHMHVREFIKKAERHIRGSRVLALALTVFLAAGTLSACANKLMSPNQSDNINNTQINDGELPLGAPGGSGDPAEALATASATDVVIADNATPAPETSAAPTPTPQVAPVATPAPAPKPSPIAAPRPNPSPAPKALAPIVNPYVRYTPDQMTTEAKKLEERYPDIIKLESIGKSVEGRDLLLVKLGKGPKKIFLCGAHHAREYISSSYLMKMTEEYAKAYTGTGKFGNYNVKDLLNKVTIYIVPMVNPDGVNLVNKGIKTVSNQEAVEAMKMVKSTYREWKANINGVDLNRQYPAYWDVKYDNVGKPASENYKGKAAATEPEVKAIMDLTKNENFILAVSFHSKGNAIYWADKGTVGEIPGVDAISKRLSSLTKYSRMPISEKPSVYGAGYENWFRLQFNKPAFCIELTPYNNTDVPHDDKKFDTLVWNKAKYIGIFMADEAIKRK